MGQDVIDINNDGLSDVIELDMDPQDNYRKKMMLNGSVYQTYQNNDYFGYQYQYVRNTLQLNQGPRVNQKDSIGDPVFSDIGFFQALPKLTGAGLLSHRILIMMATGILLSLTVFLKISQTMIL